MEKIQVYLIPHYWKIFGGKHKANEAISLDFQIRIRKGIPSFTKFASELLTNEQRHRVLKQNFLTQFVPRVVIKFYWQNDGSYNEHL